MWCVHMTMTMFDKKNTFFHFSGGIQLTFGGSNIQQLDGWFLYLRDMTDNLVSMVGALPVLGELYLRSCVRCRNHHQ